MKRDRLHSMKTKIVTSSLCAIGFSLISAPCQGTFQNLGFESAQLIFSSTNGSVRYIAAADALPGWSAFAGTNQLTEIPYNLTNGIVAQYVGLRGPGASIIGGSYTVAIFGSIANGGSISQTGIIPTDTETLIFRANTYSPFVVSLNGQSVSYIPMSSAPNYTMYGADVSPFAGQTVTLSFGLGVGLLDDIEFSPFAIPEPSDAALFALSTLALAAGLMRGRRGRT